MLLSALLVLVGSASIAVARPGPHNSDPPIPTPYPGGNGFSYEGCYAEPRGVNALKKSWFDDGMTVEKCLSFCEPKYGQYAWVEDNK